MSPRTPAELRTAREAIGAQVRTLDRALADPVSSANPEGLRIALTIARQILVDEFDRLDAAWAVRN